MIKNENIAEEMRILYVALTRAKEMLVITGTSNDYEKELLNKTEILRAYKNNDEKINPILLKKYISYLDWIILVYLKNNMKDILNLNIIDKKEVLKSNNLCKQEIREFDFSKQINYEEIEKEINFKYDNIIKTKLPIKSTVSKLKEYDNSEEISDIIDFNVLTNSNIGLNKTIPNFIRDDETISITNTRKGTLMHLFLENVDFSKEYSFEDLIILEKSLVKQKKVSNEEEKYINIEKIEKLLSSDLIKKIRKCKIVEKEKPFCIKIKANEILNIDSNETILVQGIIDLFGITDDDKIILVDYKTDFVNDETELIKKYYTQLKLYKTALEEGFEKDVSEVYIYSLYLEKEIRLCF